MLGFINRFITLKYSLIVSRIIILLIFITLIWIGFHGRAADFGSTAYIRKTNLGSLVIWYLWWPVIIVMAVFWGRLWCIVCPIELLTTLFAKIGFRRHRPHWVLSGWGITVFYILILVVGIEGFHIHHNPVAMSVYLVTILVTALVVGLIFEKNTFCRSFCPVGNLLALYSRLSFLGWRVKSHEKCDHCPDKSCIQKDRIYSITNKSCGVDLYPAHIDSNADCILCGGCRQSCAGFNPSGVNGRPNPGLRFIGFATDLFKLRPLKMAEAVFIFVVSGFVINEILSEWTHGGMMAALAPEHFLGEGLHKNEIVSNILGFTLICIIVPSLLWLPPYLLAKAEGIRLSFQKFFRHYSIAFIPLVALAEVSNAILESVGHYKFYPLALSDWNGVQNAMLLSAGELNLSPEPGWLGILLSSLVVILLLLGIFLSIKVIQKTNLLFFPSEKKLFSFYLIPALFGVITLLAILGI